MLKKTLVWLDISEKGIPNHSLSLESGNAIYQEAYREQF